MGKYETALKLKIVERVLAVDGGAKLLARRWSVPEEKVAHHCRIVQAIA